MPTPPSSERGRELLRCRLPECDRPFVSTRAGQKFCRPEHREQHRRSRLEARAGSAVASQTGDGTAAGAHAVWNGEAWSLDGFEVATPAVPDPPLPDSRVFSTPKGTYARVGRAGSELAVGPAFSLAGPVAVLPGDTDTSRAEAHGLVGGGITPGQDGDVPLALRSAAAVQARSATSARRETRSRVGALITGSRHRPRVIAVGLAAATFGFGMWGFIPAPDTPAAIQEAVAPPAAIQKVTPAAWVSQAQSALATTQAQLNMVNAALSEWEGAATGGAVRRQPPQVAQLYAQRDRLVAQQTLLQNELADADALPSDTAALAALQERLGQITTALAGPIGAGQQAANIDALTSQRDWLTAQIAALQNQIGSLTQSVTGAQQTPLPDLTDTSTPTALAVSDLAHAPFQDPWIGQQDVAPSPLSDPQYPSSPARSDATTGAPPGGDHGQSHQGDRGGLITDVGDATQALFGGGQGNHDDNGYHDAGNATSGNGEPGGDSLTPVSLPGAAQPDPVAPIGPGATGNGDSGSGSTGDPVMHGPVFPPPGVFNPVVGEPVGGGPGKYDGPPIPGNPLPVSLPGVLWTIFGQPPVIVGDPLPSPTPPVVVDPIVIPAVPQAVTPPPGSITLLAAETATPASVPAVVAPVPVATAAKTSQAPAAKAATTSSGTASKPAKPSVSSSTSKTKKSSSKASSGKAKKSSTSKAKSVPSKATKASTSKSKASSAGKSTKSASSKSTKSSASKGGTTK